MRRRRRITQPQVVSKSYGRLSFFETGDSKRRKAIPKTHLISLINQVASWKTASSDGLGFGASLVLERNLLIDGEKMCNVQYFQIERLNVLMEVERKKNI
ncbi:hypothetical protein NPIL_536831 [Nephila pilipes]|uniref:Uncharacterized protein n=1 Tax=Nephila pilipes TaxID=299642 RepID=A0A8X6ULJ3_NEPPI|nr:hypothetical protein NPIL_536831 [Nephila pilipes]